MNNEADLKSIFNFLKTARELQHVERATPHPNGRQENDAEHSWAVALACVLVASRLSKEFGVALDQTKMLKMALIHDLAEVGTGDTKTWDDASRVNKEEKEREVMQNMIKSLPQDVADEISSLWEECEKKETLEAQIVKSIDRFDPVIHRTAFGVGWKGIDEEHASITAVDSRQEPRHSFSKTLTRLYEIIRLEADSKGVFKA
ncbi:MAG: HD domain-containing protein [Patescibacteria group bacterium]